MKKLAPMRYEKGQSPLTEGNMRGNLKWKKREVDNSDGISKLVVVVAVLVFLCMGLVATIMNERDIARLDRIEMKLDKLSIASYKDSLMDAEKKNSMLEKKILDITSKRVKVTGYHPASGGINSDSNPAMTATMTKHIAGYTCAISTELVELGWLGNKLYVEGFGMVYANDRLAPGIKGFQIDLCKGSYKDAMAVGENENVLAAVVNSKN